MMRKPDLCQPVSVSSSSGYFAGLQEVMGRIPHDLVDRIAATIWQAHETGRTIFLFGNGGSASLASHFACDLAKGTIADGRRRLRAIALTDNIPMMTAWANDCDYKEIFAEQLRGLVQKDDVVLAISGSGNSLNVVRGLEVGREAGATLIAMTGYEGGQVKDLCDVCLIVPSNDMQHIEDAHLSVAHAIYKLIRHRMSELQTG
ncbi:MAG TPA: SIS domain-containing protein [Terriglobales bacterium]|nr:SIS domain-containing protein [Terriglobales bacterium]